MGKNGERDGYRRICAAFLHDRSGTITILAVLALPVVLGFAALSVEYGYGLLRRAENQRVADLASYAGALAYNETSSQEDMASAARSAALLNGVAANDVAVALVTSPKDSSSKAVNVTITTKNTLYLAPVLGVEPELSIAAGAFASVGKSGSSCILALDEAGSGITLSGGVHIDGECYRVSSNAGITAPCGTRITTESVTYYAGELAPCKWDNSFVTLKGNPAPVVKQYTDDPLKNNSGVATFDDRFATIWKASWPAKVTSNGIEPKIIFGDGNPADAAKALNDIQCSFDPKYYNQYYTSTWVITCSKKKIYIGSIEVRNDAKVSFNASGSPDTIYNFSGSIKGGPGTSIVFGPGIFNIAKGVYGASMSFGAGTFHIGMGDEACGYPEQRYSVCSSGTMTFGGPSRFILDGGIYTGDGATLTLGSGQSNSYIINHSSAGNGISVGGGSKTYFADASANGSVFRLNGNINGHGGGSCIVLPASEHHDISGNVHLAGAVKLGAGIYTIDGYFAADVGGATCDGTGAVYGKDVTLLISGRDTASGGACRGQVFCLDGGNGITLMAPKSGPFARLAVVGPQSSDNDGGVTIAAGGRGQISGAFYFPYAKIDLGGGGRIENGPTDCMQLIGASIALSGGAKAISKCAGLDGNGKVALIQ
ncbi:hypothetical protein DUT91_16435 [Phyllobacterium salinisoli]|uniref:Putative Flp pilus-assembly TadG-like N-terminal domain-containing protein n=1 Tax=Phyllobacterium salinisoli TaxID=1899321 RepID=A0A368K0X6_9HYPH|nr:TadE/TadG family type IV pilus assembly protein [Phyllobacterium salinisoli]RCS23046.1 hypothetical protein DUT91_16435 [Phyllobacterium salinisoli]